MVFVVDWALRVHFLSIGLINLHSGTECRANHVIQVYECRAIHRCTECRAYHVIQVYECRAYHLTQVY